jgi:hypothetical protein
MELLSRKTAMIANPVDILSCHSDLHRKGFQQRDSGNKVISARETGAA